MSEELEVRDEFARMTEGQLWRNVWGSLHAADTFYGRWQQEAQERHERAWAELVKRGAARLRMFNQGEVMR